METQRPYQVAGKPNLKESLTRLGNEVEGARLSLQNWGKYLESVDDGKDTMVEAIRLRLDNAVSNLRRVAELAAAKAKE